MKPEAEFPILGQLLEQVQVVLEPEFIGFYLHGSLALGDFDAATSDIDFAVVTQNHLEPKTISQLESMHKNLFESFPNTAIMLEGAYVPCDMIRRHDVLASAIPHVHGSSFYLAQLEPHWILNREILRTCGVTLAGPQPESLIDPVSIRDRKMAVRDFLVDWWQPMLTDQSKLKNAEYRIYAVQTMARALCTLETGDLHSKLSAIRWALEHLPVEWRVTLRVAQTGQSPKLDQTRDLIR